MGNCCDSGEGVPVMLETSRHCGNQNGTVINALSTSARTFSPGQGHVDIIRSLTTPHGMHPSTGKIMVTLYSYSATVEEEISFDKGDKIEILDASENDWWRGLHLGTGEEGYVPRNYIAEENSLESEE
ncbi:unnamed protein product [Darwinula stevensoni]|uniref:SH3 domain-containing protein n=1 Tax=Darwinula stevensoni TaxID=69355 RepID=A0A7R9A4M8_9CRUS|nr:unnamed protein product [Darwinula stevensoni]CAG0884602.1 unnamed protein product [Darwinula stevensoni]